jgi:transporter family-2 protein
LPNQASFLSIAVLMFLTGIGIPIMATLYAGLSQQLGGPVAATFVMFAIVAVLCGLHDGHRIARAEPLHD